MSFDESGDPPAHYSVIFWDTTHSGLAKIRPIGTYDNHPSVNLTIDDTQIHWHGDGLVSLFLLRVISFQLLGVV